MAEDAADRRIRVLERQLMGVAAIAVLALGLAVALSVVALRRSSPGAVAAQRFDLVDESGRRRSSWFFTPEGVSFILGGGDEDKEASVALMAGKPTGFMLKRGEGHPLLRASVDDNAAAFMVADGNGRNVAEMGSDGDSTFLSAQGRRRISLQASKAGPASLSVVQVDAGVHVLLFAGVDKFDRVGISGETPDGGTWTGVR